MTCYLARWEVEGIMKYSCKEIRQIYKDWKNETYPEYMKQIDEFLDKCECEIPLVCHKCDESEHEGYFCRCEGRNIKLAKQLREKGVFKWK